MKNVYLAGKLDTGEGKLVDFAEELEARGHTVLEQWFRLGRLPKPYLQHHDSSSSAAAAMIRAAHDSDAFILFPTDDILGAAVEFGAALASTYNNPEKIVAVVDPFSVRQSVFYAHPGVVALRNLTDIRDLHWF